MDRKAFVGACHQGERWAGNIAHGDYGVLLRYILPVGLSLMAHLLLILAVDHRGGSHIVLPPQSQAAALTVTLVEPGETRGFTQSAQRMLPQPDMVKPQVTGVPDAYVHGMGSPFEEKTPVLIPVPVPAEPYYFPPKELSEKPQIAQDISPDRAVFIPALPVESTVLRLLISESGNIDRVEVDDPHISEEAKRALVEIFSTMRFHPGKLNDLPVKSQLKIEVTLEDVLAPEVVKTGPVLFIP
ncbi:MAG TPA: hypothetical protein VJ654_08975 [Noviherbaspirillum sp.]|nr:hypothetical protein [Noviherbaspirillum sp.]